MVADGEAASSLSWVQNCTSSSYERSSLPSGEQARSCTRLRTLGQLASRGPASAAVTQRTAFWNHRTIEELLWPVRAGAIHIKMPFVAAGRRGSGRQSQIYVLGGLGRARRPCCLRRLGTAGSKLAGASSEQRMIEKTMLARVVLSAAAAVVL